MGTAKCRPIFLRSKLMFLAGNREAVRTFVREHRSRGPKTHPALAGRFRPVHRLISIAMKLGGCSSVRWKHGNANAAGDRNRSAFQNNGFLKSSDQQQRDRIRRRILRTIFHLLSGTHRLRSWRACPIAGCAPEGGLQPRARVHLQRDGQAYH